MKILVVEDKEADAKLLRSVLERGGHEVCRAESAEQAMRMLEDGDDAAAPQAIVTDLDLPQMDGVTLARHLHGTARTAHIPVIAVTAYPDHFPQGSGDRECFAAYVVKPIDTRSLAGLVTTVCANHRN